MIHNLILIEITSILAPYNRGLDVMQYATEDGKVSDIFKYNLDVSS